jgi:hypothetical protein
MQVGHGVEIPLVARPITDGSVAWCAVAHGWVSGDMWVWRGSPPADCQIEQRAAVAPRHPDSPRCNTKITTCVPPRDNCLTLRHPKRRERAQRAVAVVVDSPGQWTAVRLRCGYRGARRGLVAALGADRTSPTVQVQRSPEYRHCMARVATTMHWTPVGLGQGPRASPRSQSMNAGRTPRRHTGPRLYFQSRDHAAAAETTSIHGTRDVARPRDKVRLGADRSAVATANVRGARGPRLSRGQGSSWCRQIPDRHRKRAGCPRGPRSSRGQGSSRARKCLSPPQTCTVPSGIKVVPRSSLGHEFRGTRVVTRARGPGTSRRRGRRRPRPRGALRTSG